MGTEERFESIEKRLKAMETELRDLQIRAELNDIMGRYAALFSAGCGRELVDSLWSKEDDVQIEYGASGVYRKFWKMERFYVKEAVPGKMSTVSFFSPVLSVREDGMEATGLWFALATETDSGDLGSRDIPEESERRMLLTSETADGKAYRAEVLLQKYSVSFRKEEGGWKIMKLHVYDMFRTPFSEDWVRFAEKRFETDGRWLESLFDSELPIPPEGHGENLPSGPSTEHWQYTLGCMQKRTPGSI